MSTHLWIPQQTSVPVPADVAAYLLQQHWKLEDASAHWAHYSKELDGERVTLEVPQRAASPDYPRVLGVLMDDLARVESRFPALILRDMRAAALDLIRISIVGSSTRDGRIPVEAGSRVYEAGRDMLLAAACSVLDPRPVFAKRKPEEAMSLLNRAKFGQTEVGSFVLTIECAVPPPATAGARGRRGPRGAF